MTDAAVDTPEQSVKSKKKPLLLSLLLAVIGAGGGYYAMSEGMIPIGGETRSKVDSGEPGALPDIAFVELDPIMISLTNERAAQHLRFRAQIEVDGKHKNEVELLRPRIIDVLNSYLRAIELEDLTAPSALVQLRAQMLHRIQIVVGKERVRDLLVMEFVLN